jgi:hypothetical protein
VPGIESRYFSSFDRTGGNDDGFDGTYSELYVDAKGEHVIFDALGPGVLATLWFTSRVDGNGPLDLGKVRFYFDDEDLPRLVLDADALYHGQTPPFVPPLVFDNQASSGGFASWVPLPYAARLRITTEKKAGFYIAQYDTFPPDWAIPTWRHGDVDHRLVALFDAARSGALAERRPQVSAGPIERGEVAEGGAIVLRHAGAGTVTRVRFTWQPEAGAPALMQNARIAITFDDASAPQVDAPLAMFFGSGLGAADVRAIPFTMTPGVWENRFPMPFWAGVNVAVTGAKGALAVEVGPSRWARGEAGTFFARTNARPADPGEDFEYLDVHGEGKIVGTVLTIRPPRPDVKKWWEGDMRDVIDDARTPSMHGTGHEDDHLGGWSNEFFERPFSLPMHGEPKTEIIDHPAGAQYNANTTLYRLWPGIGFLRRVQHSVEHGSRNGVLADYASLTFGYRGVDERLVRTDAVDVGDPASRAAHGYTAPGESPAVSLTSTFEGRGSHVAGNVPLSALHAAARGEVHMRLAIAPENAGVKLRRLFDQTTGRQRARVDVDGRTVGHWYVAEANGTARWAERDFVLPAAATEGKRAIEVDLVIEGDAPWDAARYEAWSIATPPAPLVRRGEMAGASTNRRR